MSTLTLGEARVLAAVLLSSKGLQPCPLRYSHFTCKTENLHLRTQLASHPASRNEPSVQVQLAGLIDDCERDCILQILTGAASAVVAVRTWTPEGEVYVWSRLPPTPIVVENAGGTVPTSIAIPAAGLRRATSMAHTSIVPSSSRLSLNLAASTCPRDARNSSPIGRTWSNCRPSMRRP